MWKKEEKKDYKAIKLFNSLLRNFEVSFKPAEQLASSKKSGLKQQSSLFIFITYAKNTTRP